MSVKPLSAHALLGDRFNPLIGVAISGCGSLDGVSQYRSDHQELESRKVDVLRLVLAILYDNIVPMTLLHGPHRDSHSLLGDNGAYMSRIVVVEYPVITEIASQTSTDSDRRFTFFGHECSPFLKTISW
jgi:hypothetical protein